MHHPPIVTPSTRVFLQRTRSTTSVIFCVYRIRSILFFTLSYSLTPLLTTWFVVGQFLAFSVPYPHRANRFFVLLLYPLLAHCPRIHPRHCCSNLSTTSNSVYNYICNLKGSKGVSIIMVLSENVRCWIFSGGPHVSIHENKGVYISRTATENEKCPRVGTRS
ncbi:uncharacterized protein EDB91DRAFT_273880 [Suillus paluster]|uniref:uncharacterized protein n=1 Tax=Suillus paluster TaxID=48578 RepID=UPI001B85BE43|nr:uncharacterized protein EDB91DRAFT_273880 [Suillus paluster]KAG1755113.1 hypothetical protein EDB91DRAFT_273880 [Suillus paluster]